MSVNVVVTGAAGGMGSATVRLLAERGANVLAVDRDPDLLDELVHEMKGDFPGVVARAADVGDPDEVSSLFDEALERWDGLDGLFNIAAILGEFKPIAESSNEGFDEVMRVNLKSAWYTMKSALPHLIRRGGGAIVNTGSYLAWHGCELLGPYNVSKHALVGLTKTAAVEYASATSASISSARGRLRPGCTWTRRLRSARKTLRRQGRTGEERGHRPDRQARRDRPGRRLPVAGRPFATDRSAYTGGRGISAK